MGTNDKTDFLKECMSDPALVSQPIPIDQFSRSFCVVCGYKPCVRSAASGMIFTERVANWKSRMFTDVPRASDNDPNYARIRAKNFQNLNEPLVVNVQPEVPLVHSEPSGPPVHSTPPEPTEPPVQVVQTPPAVPPLVMTHPVPPPGAQQQGEPTLTNTPFQSGMVLPGKPVDKKEDKFVEPGAIITFGEDE
jgi:hypothetical protein